jgi:hypothetical protein
MVLSRAYVEQYGGGWDGPGIVAHEGYRHWFIDNEIVTAAKLRGVWAPCVAAVVEHRHPYFGTGEMDDTYRIGQAAAETDGALFRERYGRAINAEEG